jgi:acetyl-CoA carboxylase carboxyltransferase component
MVSLCVFFKAPQYDMMEIINRLVDNSEFEAHGYGQTIITGYARIDGWAVGIVANQRKVVKLKGRNAVWRSNLFR